MLDIMLTNIDFPFELKFIIDINNNIIPIKRDSIFRVLKVR